jgi:hypothetical protein
LNDARDGCSKWSAASAFLDQRSRSPRAHPDAERPGSPMMRIRLRLLVTSFNKAVMDYALARLEVALANPGAPAPPVLQRLGPYVRLDDRFAVAWPDAIARVREAKEFVAGVKAGARGVKRDAAWERLERAAASASQFAQSIEWIGVESGAAAPGEEHS